MIVKTFTKNENNKIEFTGEELKKLLDEVYKDGYKDGKECNNYSYYTYCTPKWTPEPWWTYVTCDVPLSTCNDPSSTCNDSSSTASDYINITNRGEIK